MKEMHPLHCARAVHWSPVKLLSRDNQLSATLPVRGTLPAPSAFPNADIPTLPCPNPRRRPVAYAHVGEGATSKVHLQLT